MIRHPFTLSRSAQELDIALRSAILSEAWMNDKDVLVLVWEKGREQLYLECHLRDPFVSPCLRHQQSRPRHHTQDVLEIGLGAMVRKVQHRDPDRILLIECQRVTIHIQLFGGGKANVLLCNGDNYIIDAAKHKRSLIAKEVQNKALSFATLAEADQAMRLHKYLSSTVDQLGPWYASELMYRMSIDESLTLADCDTELLGRCIEASAQLKRECLTSSQVFILQNKTGDEVLSLIPLHGYAEQAQYTSLQDAVQWRVIHLHQVFKRKMMLDSLRTSALKEERRLLRALEGMREAIESTEKQQKLQYAADLLLSQPSVHRSGLSELRVSGWYDDQVHIVLDPKYNLAENAERYYQKARRSREARRITLERQPAYQAKLELVRTLLAELEADPTNERLQELFIKMQPKTKTTDAAKTGVDASVYRQFELAPGYTLYVGRSAANNDELTMRFAKQNDLWFHARGVSGSHAVLRCADAGKVPKAIVEKAGAIAAYYSKARNAKYTPVVYTQRKYVRKPKGAAVGAVHLEREEVMMVEPRLPDGMKDQE